MPCHISQSKRRSIEVKIVLGRPTKEIADDHNVSRRSVQRFSKNFRVHRSIALPKGISQDRPRTIIPEMEEVHVISLSSATCHCGHALIQSHF